MRYDRPPVTVPTGLPAGSASAGWRFAFRVLYRLLRLVDPLLRVWWRLRGPLLGRTVDVRVVGRRSGRPRPVLVTLLTVGGARYVGHPNGEAPWARNVEAAGGFELGLADGRRSSVRAVRLPHGAERDAVIRATWDQQPFLANVIYRLAWAHIRAVGVYFRLEAPAE